MQPKRRYVPKGGHIVDFTSEDSIRRANLRKRALECRASCKRVDEWSENSCGGIKLQGAQKRDPRRQSPASVSLNEDQRLDQPKHETDSYALPKDIEFCQSEKATKLAWLSNTSVSHWPAEETLKRTPEKQHWRPPGPVSARRKGTVSSKPIQTYKASHPHNTTSTHDCESCKRCQQLQDTLSAELMETKKERAAAACTQRRFEAALAKVSKEQHAFNEWKQEQESALRAAAEDAMHKLHRNRLAEEARRRSVNKKALQDHHKEVEELKSALEAVRREAALRAAQHQIEMQYLKRQEQKLKADNQELRERVAEAEEERLSAWKMCEKAVEPGKASGRGGSPRLTVNAAREPVHADAFAERGVLNKHTKHHPENISLKRGAKVVSNANTASNVRHGSPAIAPSNTAWHSPTRTPRAASTTVSSMLIECSKSSSRAVTSLASSTASPPFVDGAGTSCGTEPQVHVYDNATVLKRWMDGRAVTKYANGDVKQTLPSGVVEYYFAAVDAWQVSYPHATEVFYFACGRVEAYLSNGIKETLEAGRNAMFRCLPDAAMNLPVPATVLCREIFMPKPVLLE
jgi:hypothetical protein